MNRKQFIESHGAICDNWTWSWSFVNHNQRFVIFGAWDRFTDGKKEMILTEDWRINRGGRKSPGYSQSREHIRLVEEDGYELYTFPMEYSEELEGDDGTGPGKIGGFTPELHRKNLTKVGSFWYAGEEGENSTLPEEIPARGRFSEGAKSTVTINAYERSAKARAACIAHHGVSCAVCGFDFESVFGDLGVGFIHVHHIVPIGSIRDEYEVDPISDLVPVCPNCHAMIHRVEPPLTIKQLREHLTEIKNANKAEQATPNGALVLSFMSKKEVTMQEPHQIYESMMMEVKFRIKVIDEYLGKSNNKLVPMDSEICFLQIRKIIEQVCFACILCDVKRYKDFRELEGLTSDKDHGDYTKDWNSEFILKSLNDISPYFMPRPLGQMIIKNGKKHFDKTDLEITHKKLIKMYQKCGGFLHMLKPFGESYESYILRQKQKYEAATKTISDYSSYLKALLWKHAAIGLEYEEEGDPLELANPQNAWIVDFGSKESHNVSVIPSVAE